MSKNMNAPANGEPTPSDYDQVVYDDGSYQHGSAGRNSPYPLGPNGKIIPLDVAGSKGVPVPPEKSLEQSSREYDRQYGYDSSD